MGLIRRKGWQYGDWLALDKKPGSSFGATPHDLVATAFDANSVRILGESARILGEGADAEAYSSLHLDIVSAFGRRFLDHFGHLTARTQTTRALALAFDLVPPGARRTVADDLLLLIEEAGGHLTTGFLGTAHLCPVLVEAGHADAAMLLLRTEYPSWCYPVTKGATTIWERWDGITPDGSLSSPGMNSFNHYTYGAVGRYLNEHVAGLAPLEPGYRRILVRPRPCPGLDSAEASLESPYGRIEVGWRLSDGVMHLAVRIPANAFALDFRPAADGGSLDREGLSIGSGRHEWSYAWGTWKSGLANAS